jgi:flavin-dependent dehydrogenase
VRAPRAKRYDTIVVGAGPAGVTAAYEASLGSDVLLIDSSSLPRDKSCGGMLHGAARLTIERYGWIPSDIGVEPRQVRFRYHDWDREILKVTDLVFANVDRAAFDDWLRRTIVPADVEVLDGCALESLVEEEHGVLASLRTADGTFSVRCANLIGADGARSTVRRAVGAEPAPTYVTVQDFLRIDGEIDPVFDCIYMRDIGNELAYAYVVPKGETAIVGSIYYPKTKRPGEKHDRVVSAVRDRVPQLGESVKREAAAALCIRSMADISHGHGRVLLAGEAGGFMSPTSGEGISYALESGTQAGRAVAERPMCALSAYVSSMRPTVADIRRRLRWLPFMESPRGKYLAGFVPTPLVSRITHGL